MWEEWLKIICFFLHTGFFCYLLSLSPWHTYEFDLLNLTSLKYTKILWNILSSERVQKTRPSRMCVVCSPFILQDSAVACGKFNCENNRPFAAGVHVTTATLNWSVMTKWYPEMEKAVSAVGFKYVKNVKQQKIGYFIRICMTGEQALLSSTIFTYISSEKIWFYISCDFGNM